MRIIHTADWHMGLRLGHCDRTDDLTRALQQVADICISEHADVLLVCGDLFDGSTRTDLVAHWAKVLADTFGPFLVGGGTIVALTGNHDNESLAQTLRHWLALADPGAAAKAGGLLKTGRVHLFAGPTFFRLADPAGQQVQFVVMPSPTVARYQLGDAPAAADERDRALKAAFRATLDGMPSRPGYDATKHTVLAAHVPTLGAVVRAGGQTYEAVAGGGGVTLADGELPTGYAYVALGDIHRPQALLGLDHVRYGGSIDRMDGGESGEEKSVAVVDVGPAGLAGPVRLAPLDATPIYAVTVDDPPAQMPTLATVCPDHLTALVKLTVRYQPGRDDPVALRAELDALFPRCYARDFAPQSGDAAADSPADPHGATAARTVPDVVRDYLSQRLTDHPDRAALLTIADELLAESD